MAQRKPKEEPEVPCVCGRNPCTVKIRGKIMLSCPAPASCGARSLWATNEQQAIKSWNTEIKIMAKERSQKNGRQ